MGWFLDFGFWLWLSVVVVVDCGGCKGGLLWAVVVMGCVVYITI